MVKAEIRLPALSRKQCAHEFARTGRLIGAKIIDMQIFARFKRFFSLALFINILREKERERDREREREKL